MRSALIRHGLFVATLLPLVACQTESGQVSHAVPETERATTVEAEGVLSTQLVDFAAAQQRDPAWCWATCAEMILHFNGEQATQEEIALRIHGTDEHGEARIQGASFYEILCALNPDIEPRPFEQVWTEVETRISEDPTLMMGVAIDMDYTAAGIALADQYVPSTAVAVADLREGHPAVVGMHDPEVPGSGHAYVLVGAEYTVNDKAGWGTRTRDAVNDLGGLVGFGSKKAEDPLAEEALERIDGDAFPATAITVVDPWTGETTSFTEQEFAGRVDFVISRRQARQTLERWQNAATLEQD